MYCELYGREYTLLDTDSATGDYEIAVDDASGEEHETVIVPAKEAVEYATNGRFTQQSFEEFCNDIVSELC